MGSIAPVVHRLVLLLLLHATKGREDITQRKEADARDGSTALPLQEQWLHGKDDGCEPV